ncbi:MAG TPA: hypothetical protein VKE69_00020 [Planctomycetota bacterium]|nr:hypothetical protein [Planctomycetota bacterium]
MRHRFLALVGAALFAAPLASQQVLVVAPAPGPGVFSTTIQAAVDAASEGDVVLVKGGSYLGFLVARKAVTIAADAGALVSIRTPVRVFNLAASQRVVVRGLRIDVSGMFAGAASTAVLFQGNAGPVWLERCAIQGTLATDKGTSGVALATYGSESVVLERTWIRGGRWVQLPIVGPSGAPAVVAYESSVSLHDCDVAGGDAGPPWFPEYPTAGGAGIVSSQGRVFVSGSIVRGGDGGSTTVSLAGGGAGGPGLTAGGDVVALASTFSGGAAGLGGPGGSAGAPGVSTILAEGGSFATLPGAARHFVAESPIREQQASTWTFGGASGEVAAAIVATDPAPGPLLPFFGGELLVSAASAVAFPIGTVSTSGSLAASIAVPSLPPALLGATLFVQSLFVDVSTTAVAIGPVSSLLILDSSL